MYYRTFQRDRESENKTEDQEAGRKQKKNRKRNSILVLTGKWSYFQNFISLPTIIL